MNPNTRTAPTAKTTMARTMRNVTYRLAALPNDWSPWSGRGVTHAAEAVAGLGTRDVSTATTADIAFGASRWRTCFRVAGPHAGSLLGLILPASGKTLDCPDDPHNRHECKGQRLIGQ